MINKLTNCVDMSHHLKVMTNNKLRIHRHLVILFIIGMTFYTSNGSSFYAEPFLTYYKTAFCALGLVLCYVNMYVLVPRLLFGGSSPMYTLSFAGLIFISFIAILIAQGIFRSMDQSKYDRMIYIPQFVQNLFLTTIFLASSTAIKLFQQWIRDTDRINELLRTGMQSELEQLKNQINPHFLFNMLNNANVLTQRDPAKASQMLMKLSDLLRYQLYDSAREKVLLTADIQFLNDSLDLEKIRRDNFEYTVSKAGQISGIQVPPFLFITFVENAIKHSLSPENASFVCIYFDIQNDRLDFVCVNSQPVKRPESVIGGLGLKNVKRRLELLFPQRHQLDINDEDNLYTVKLNIQL
jgi:sensor histidine kinase YesM